ncbi:MAG: Circadian input kinase A [Nitrospira sp.]|nr:MAG: Circadian input kinase A [Nitrospira sp.]
MQTHILIVDDDPDIRESLGDMLSHEGYVVRNAASGAEALERAKQERYEAALLDIQLPDLNGLSVLKVMIELDPSLPIIILTGNATPENTIGSLAKGAFAYLTKPYNSQELKAVLRRAVSVKGLAVRAEHVEQALHASEERFRALVESATDAIVLADQSGHIIWWNGAAERMFGYNKQEALGHSLTMLMPERFRSAHDAGIMRVTQGGTPKLIGSTIELVGLTKAGQEFPIELSLASWHAKEGIFFSGIIRNITRRKRAEESVVRLSHQNALILDSAGEGIFGLDLQGRATFVNATGARMLGWSSAELIGKTMAPLLYRTEGGGSSRTSDPFSLQSALCDGAVHRIQNETFVKKDGSPFPVHYVTSPIREQDRLVGAVVVFQDIAERKRQESLQQAQLSISHLLAQAGTIEEAIPQLLHVVGEMGPWEMALLWHQTPNGEAMACRGAWVRPSGRWDDFVTLCRNSEFPPGIDFPGVAWSTKLPLWIPDAMTDSRFTRRPTASRLGLHGACAVPIRTGGVIHGVLELFSDVSRPADSNLIQIMVDTGMKIGQFIDRARAGQALRATHDMTQNLLAGLPGAIFLCGRDLHIQYANNLAHRYFGQPGASLIGRPLSDYLALSEPATQALLRERLALPVESAWAMPERECEIAKRVYRYRFFPVTTPEQSHYQMGIVLWDITEEKQLQDQLIQAEKLSSLGTMVSGMAHEINNPAQAILSMAELIQEEADPAKVKEFAADIVDYARHVSTVVRDFASYARSSGRDGETVIDVAERLMEAVKMVRRGPHFGYVEVVTHFEALAFLRARKGEIDQVFVNLINNAAQAMNGTGRLTLATAQDGGWIDVAVADNGPGIPPSVLPKIFDPFFTTKEAGKGTGLGLSIVHKIVTKHGGTITVDSIEGRGTTFRLRFPAVPR